MEFAPYLALKMPEIIEIHWGFGIAETAQILSLKHVTFLGAVMVSFSVTRNQTQTLHIWNIYLHLSYI